MDGILQALQKWYADQCDGDWEHGSGIEITTLDNPGWLVKIDLVGTELEARSFEPISDPVDAPDFEQSDHWLHCSITNGVWQGAGDETKLLVILQTFLAWAAIH
jgi:hypothetical protein